MFRKIVAFVFATFVAAHVSASANLAADSATGSVYGDQLRAMNPLDVEPYTKGALDAFAAVLAELSARMDAGDANPADTTVRELIQALTSLPQGATTQDAASALYDYAAEAPDRANSNAALLLWKAMLAGRIRAGAPAPPRTAQGALRCTFGCP